MDERYEAFNWFVIEGIGLDGNKRTQSLTNHVEGLVNGKWTPVFYFAREIFNFHAVDSARELGKTIAEYATGEKNSRDRLKMSYEPPKAEPHSWESFSSEIFLDCSKPSILNCRAPTETEKEEFFIGLLERIQGIARQVKEEAVTA